MNMFLHRLNDRASGQRSARLDRKIRQRFAVVMHGDGPRQGGRILLSHCHPQRKIRSGNEDRNRRGGEDDVRLGILENYRGAIIGSRRVLGEEVKREGSRLPRRQFQRPHRTIAGEIPDQPAAKVRQQGKHLLRGLVELRTCTASTWS